MGKPWYRRKQHGSLGYTYPVSWKGWAHLFGSLAAVAGLLALSMKTGIYDSYPAFVSIGVFLLVLGVAAVGFAKTEYVEV